MRFVLIAIGINHTE